MARIEKDYFAFEEIEDRWEISRRDLAYLAENGLLKTSVRLYGVHIEQGCYEETNGQWFTIPEQRVWFQGLQDLRPEDVHRLFHEERITVDRFDAPEHHYCHVLRPEGGVLVGRDELVVRREERDCAEARHGLGGVRRATQVPFDQKNEFAEVTLEDRTYTFGPIQAQVVRILYEAAESGSPWRYGKRVLAEAGSSSTRIADLFKTQPDWRRLIESDHRGKYRLNIRFS